MGAGCAWEVGLKSKDGHVDVQWWWIQYCTQFAEEYINRYVRLVYVTPAGTVLATFIIGEMHLDSGIQKPMLHLHIRVQSILQTPDTSMDAS